MSSNKKATISADDVVISKRKNSRRGKKKKAATSRPAEAESEQQEHGGQEQQDLNELPSETVAQQIPEPPLSCECCGIRLKSHDQLVIHRKSKRHARRRHQARIAATLQQMPELRESVPASSAEAIAARLARGEVETPAPLTDATLPACISRTTSGKIGQRVTYACSPCDVQLTSLITAQKHLQSSRHKAVAQGLPPPARTQPPHLRKVKRSAAARNSWFW